ncbi:MAG: Trm112 family protein [Pseudomonadota bacterium]
MTETHSESTPGPCGVSPRLLEVLICPVTGGPLIFDKAACELISKKAKLAYPIRDGLPILLESEARDLDAPAS